MLIEFSGSASENLLLKNAEKRKSKCNNERRIENPVEHVGWSLLRR